MGGLRLVPSFCRHNRILQNCPICTREQNLEVRPVVSGGDVTDGSARSSGVGATRPRQDSSPRPAGVADRGVTRQRREGGAQRRSSGPAVTVRRLARGTEDGYRSPLVPGLKSSEDAERLVDELAFAARRLEVVGSETEGVWGEIADTSGDIEERTWLAFLVAYLSPLEDSPEPFASIEAVRVSWASGELPDLDGVTMGPRTAHTPGQGTLEAYRTWVARAGSQAAAFSGEDAWTPERRFERIFERLSLPGLHRDARFELLVLLGQTSVFELQAGSLRLGGDDETTVAAKRVLGIGDPMLLERRALDLGVACGVPLAALDLGLRNWGVGERYPAGLAPGVEPDPVVLERAREALEL
jgi:hypothetical protein